MPNKNVKSSVCDQLPAPQTHSSYTDISILILKFWIKKKHGHVRSSTIHTILDILIQCILVY